MTKAIAIDPDQVIALYNLAQVVDVSESTLAIRHLRHVLELRPGWAPAQSSLAWYLARGDGDERIEALAIARTAVNRMWGHFFGVGFVDPIDDFRGREPMMCLKHPTRPKSERSADY
jgi:hypothetical protein